jgi:hypothetical protein
VYYTVAYPHLSKEDGAFIEEYRRLHDIPYRDVIEAHFTLVFGCREIPEPDYLRHVESVAEAFQRFEFCCRYAMLGSDAEAETAYVFLVPDEGHSTVSLLHDRLYTGPLAPFLRLDIPFTPHIGIGTLGDRHEAKRLCDELNQESLLIHGAVVTVTVGVLEGEKFLDVASFELRGRTP